MVEIGESIGILAAQSIGEPGTQLTMRTFHTGGIFSSEAEKSIVSPTNGTLQYSNKKGGKKVLTKYKEKVFFTYKEKKIKISNKKFKSYIITLPKYSVIYSPPNKKIFNQQIIAKVTNWRKKKLKKSKELKEIKTEISGLILSNKKIIVNNLKRKNRVMKKETKLWILSGNIITYLQLIKNLKNSLQFSHFKTNKKVYCKNKLKNLLPIKKIQEKKIENYIIQCKVEKKKQLLIKKSTNESKLFLKNTTKIGNLISKNQKVSKKLVNKHNIQTTQTRKNLLIAKLSKPYKVSNKGKLITNETTTINKNHNIAYTFHKEQKNEDIVQGLPKVEELLEAKKNTNFVKIINNPHDKLRSIFQRMLTIFPSEIAVRKSIEKIQNYLADNVQKVYISQGVKISIKHIEVITKQMTSKAIIIDSNDGRLLIGEIIEINKIEKMNKCKDMKIVYEPMILGISKVALTSQSFIAEACFQETMRVLTKSAIQGRIDWLYGLKENVILGNIIPAGTGFKPHK